MVGIIGGKKYEVVGFIVLLCLTLPLFLYKIGDSSLVSWDEAWYGEIAKNVLKGDILNLKFNQAAYIDHPPAGFWFIALSQLLFRINEFGTRFASAAFGFLTLIVIFLLGRNLFNGFVGFLSAIALVSAPWFLYRARSGNLDTILTFFLVLSIYLAVKAAKDKHFLIPLSFSLSLFFLTKSIIPFTIIPVLIILFWRSKIYKLKDFLVPIVIFLILFGGWFISQYRIDPTFHIHYLAIGAPEVNLEASYTKNLLLSKEYLHSGIGRWFWPTIIAIFIGSFFLKKKFLIFFAFFVTFFTPFILSHKGHIWHLIPLFPVLILNFMGASFEVWKKILKKPTLVYLILAIFTFYISFSQIKQNWYQFIDIPTYVSDEAILSKEAGKYEHPYYIEGDFTPAAVFYSDKMVKRVRIEGLVDLFKSDSTFLLNTKLGVLNEYGILPIQYRIIKADRDRVLVIKDKFL